MKKLKNKIKYLNSLYDKDHEELAEDFEVVPNPTIWNNLPDGGYLIRGNNKYHAKKYWMKDNIWYLVDVFTKNVGQYECVAGTYQLFPPNVTDKEWKILYSVYGALSSQWKRWVNGYRHYMDIRQIHRDFKQMDMIL